MVVLPQAMAYGVALFALAGKDAASGALAGLIGAACLSLVSGVLGSTVGAISAPTGPALVLLSGSVIALADAGLAGESLAGGLLAIIVLAGFIQMAIAVSGGGRLIKFIPYPVVVGFMTGAALLMIHSQVRPVLAPLGAEGSDLIAWIPLAGALATFVAMWACARWFAAVPPAIPGLLLGALVFHALIGFGPGTAPAAWVVGVLPDVTTLDYGFSVAALDELPVAVLVSGALAFAMLASLNTLLASVIADLTTETRHDARRELLAQGMGQALAGLAGGMGGSATTGATVVAVRTGARRWAGATAGAMFLALVIFFGPAGKLLPISVLAGIIIYVAATMIERDMFDWLRSGRTRNDALVALLVTIVTVAYDLVTAVGVGVVIAIVLFIRSQAQTSVIHRRSTGAQRRSVRSRTEDERALLATHGDRIVLYELRGNLFFATADSLFEELLSDLDRPGWLILHLRRVSQVDLTGIKILHQIATRLHGHGGQLLFCEVHHELRLGEDMREAFARVSQASSGGREVLTFVGSEEALEYAEDALLSEFGRAPAVSHAPVELAETDLCRNMTPGQVAALATVVRARTAEAGAKLLSTGERGDEMFLVMHGEAEARLQTTPHHYKRLAKYGPGTFFGEVAFLDPGPRTADIVVTQTAELLVLDRAGFTRLERENPGAAVALLMALGRMQGHHLRHSAEEVQRLAQW
jgi:SulP family sulfate permease